jgi:hypothetical protein
MSESSDSYLCLAYLYSFCHRTAVLIVIFIPFVFLVAVTHQWSLPKGIVNNIVSVVAAFYIPPCTVPG